MRFTVVILSAFLCFGTAKAENAPIEKVSDEALMAAAEQMVNEGKKAPDQSATTASTTTPVQAGATAATTTPTTTPTTPSTTTASAQIAQDIKKESEIPVFTKSDKVAKSEDSLLWRLLMSLGFIVVLSGGLIFAGRKWSRQKDKGGQKARIELLHQFHMGPRKSVALIRVAGEAILIGCTDHNVNMLKSIALIDDELENALGKDFNNFLEEEFTVEDVRKALAPRI